MSKRTSKPNIRKRGTTYTWYAYITSGDGRRRQISQGGFRTIAEAESDRIAKLTELGHGDYVTPDRISLATYLLIGPLLKPSIRKALATENLGHKRAAESQAPPATQP